MKDLKKVMIPLSINAQGSTDMILTVGEHSAQEFLDAGLQSLVLSWWRDKLYKHIGQAEGAFIFQDTIQKAVDMLDTLGLLEEERQ